MKHLGRAALLFVLTVSTSTPALQTGSAALPQINEEVIGVLNDNASARWTKGRSMAILGGSRVLWLEKLNGEPTVFVDGRAQPAPAKPKSVDPVSQPQIMPHSRTGQADDQILEGNEIGFSAFSPPWVTLSPIGQPVYVSEKDKKDKKLHVITDNKEDIAVEAEGIGRLEFDTTGKLIAYQVLGKNARRDYKWFWVINGQKGPEFDTIGRLIFSKDGKRFAYAGASDTTKGHHHAVGTIVIDGKQEPDFATANELPFHFWSRDGHDMFVAEEQGVSDPALSADGSRVAYARHRGKQDECVFVDRECGPAFESIVYGPYFSADGQHFGYLASTGGGKKLLEVRDHKVVREMNLHDANFFGGMGISPDLSKIAFILGKRGADWEFDIAHRRVVVDGQEQNDIHCLAMDNLQFSPNGHHLAYRVTPPAKFGSVQPRYMVFDGIASKLYDEIIPGSLAFIDDHTFRYVARQGKTFLRVTTKLD